MYLHNILAIVEENLIMNFDQTPLKYVPASNDTMAKKTVKSVCITGSFDKRYITGTFVITLEGDFLPVAAYQRCQNKVCPDVNFQSRSR